VAVLACVESKEVHGRIAWPAADHEPGSFEDVERRRVGLLLIIGDTEDQFLQPLHFPRVGHHRRLGSEFFEERFQRTLEESAESLVDSFCLGTELGNVDGRHAKPLIKAWEGCHSSEGTLSELLHASPCLPSVE